MSRLLIEVNKTLTNFKWSVFGVDYLTSLYLYGARCLGWRNEDRDEDDRVGKGT